MNKRYPNISQYKNAIVEPESFSKLESGISAVLEENQAVFASGNFATVFKMQYNSKQYALKCFLKGVDGRDFRQKEISKYIKENPSNYFIDFEYLENELWVEIDGGTEYAVSWMEWIDAPTLGEKIERYVKSKNKTGLLKLSQGFKKMAFWLLHEPFSHGDLKHDNLIVKRNGEFILVDYDGMFVPALKGEISNELGGKSYQHPKRLPKKFNNNLDDFSILIIYISLYALYKDPSLYERYNNGQNIIFSSSDYKKPLKSELITELFEYEELKGALNVLIESISSNKISIENLFGIIDEVEKFNFLEVWQSKLLEKEKKNNEKELDYIRLQDEVVRLSKEVASLERNIKDKKNKLDDFSKSYSLKKSELEKLERSIKSRGDELSKRENKYLFDLGLLDRKETVIGNQKDKLKSLSRDLDKRESNLRESISSIRIEERVNKRIQREFSEKNSELESRENEINNKIQEFDRKLSVRIFNFLTSNWGIVLIILVSVILASLFGNELTQKDMGPVIYRTTPVENFSVSVRELPNSTSRILYRIPKGAAVSVIDTSSFFYKVHVNGHLGYVYHENLKNQIKKRDENTHPVELEENSYSDVVPSEFLFVTKVSNSINLREDKLFSSKTLCEVPAHSLVYVLEIAEESNYCKVAYDGKLGYVESFYLDSEILDSNNLFEPYQSEIILRNSIALKSESNNSSSVIMYIPGNSKVVVLDTTLSNTDYTKVIYKNERGFIKKESLGYNLNIVNIRPFVGTMTVNFGVDFKEYPYVNSRPYRTLTSSSKFIVIGEVNNYYRISFKGKTGYVPINYVRRLNNTKVEGFPYRGYVDAVNGAFLIINPEETNERKINLRNNDVVSVIGEGDKQYLKVFFQGEIGYVRSFFIKKMN